MLVVTKFVSLLHQLINWFVQSLVRCTIKRSKVQHQTIKGNPSPLTKLEVGLGPADLLLAVRRVKHPPISSQRALIAAVWLWTQGDKSSSPLVSIHLSSAPVSAQLLHTQDHRSKSNFNAWLDTRAAAGLSWPLTCLIDSVQAEACSYDVFDSVVVCFWWG